LAGVRTPAEQAQALNLGYSTITRWLRDFREEGLPGLFPATHYSREPYTPERVIVQLLYFKCCAPKAGDRELARVIQNVTGRPLSHPTMKALCERFFFWRHAEFQKLVRYPKPQDPLALRQEIVRLHQQGWTVIRITELLRVSCKTVRKWLRRARQQSATPETGQLPLVDLPRAPHQPQRKVYFGAIHAVLTRSVQVVEPRELREGPPKSRHPFQHTFIDLRYLDAKPEGVQLYSCLLLEGFSRTILAGSVP
jgi:transposase